MKKLLFALLAFSVLQKSEAQSIYNETCEGLTIGNIDENVFDSFAGQGGLFADANQGPTDPADSPNAADFQVINTGILSYGNALQIKGSPGNGRTRTITKDFLQGWNARTLGNNTVVVKFRIYLPTLTASDNTFKFSIKSSSSRTFCSLTINKSSTVAGKYDIRGNYFNGLQPTDPSLPTISYRPSGNQYENFILMYNVDTGNFRLVGGTLSNPLFDVNATGVPAISKPQDILFFVKKSNISTTQNASSMFYNVDAIEIDAENTTLGIDENTFNNSFNAFFDSVNNIIKINANDDTNIKSVTIYNINGREIKYNIYNNIKNTEIDVLEFPAGIYILKLITDKGTLSKKIIKT